MAGYQNQEFTSAFSNPSDFFKPGAYPGVFDERYKLFSGNNNASLWNSFKPSTPTSSSQENPNKNFDTAKAIDAVTKSLNWQNSQRQNANSTGSSGISGGGGVQQAGDITAIYPIVTQETKTTAGSSGSGLGSTLGTIAGIGASIAFPGLGSAVTAALPGLGGAVGGLFG